MKTRKTFGVFAKYIPFLLLLCMYGFSLYRDAITITDSTERLVRILKDILLLNLTLGLFGGLFTLDRLRSLVLGSPQNIVDDIREQDSGDFAVSYNGLMGSSMHLSVILVFVTVYLLTNQQLFATCAIILSCGSVLITAALMLSQYLQNRHQQHNNILVYLANPIFLPMLIWLLLYLITNIHTVRFIYNGIQDPYNTIVQILSLSILLCYILAVAFCHFSNIYCFISFSFITKNPSSIQAKINELEEKHTCREDNLRQTTKCVDETAPQVGFLKKVGFGIRLIHTHAKTYYGERCDAVIYLVLLLRLKIHKTFGALLIGDRLKINMIRFCEITFTVELLVLNMILFIYLGSDNPCARFFEVLSTVIIIPIILASLTSLKEKNAKNRSNH